MKFTNSIQVDDFLNVVEKCTGDVILSSQHGDNFNLKSSFSRYIAIGELLGEHGDELELFASNKKDEAMLMQFLQNHPEI